MKRDNEKNRRLQRERKKSEVALRKAGVDIEELMIDTRPFIFSTLDIKRGGEGWEVSFPGEFLFDWGEGTIRLYKDHCSHVYNHKGSYKLRIGKNTHHKEGGLSWRRLEPGSAGGVSQVVGEEIPEYKPVSAPVIKKTNIPYDAKGGALDEFVTVWRVNAGDKVTLPAWGDYRIDWGDRTTATLRGVKQSCEHVYDKAGDYEVRVSNTAQWGDSFHQSRIDEVYEARRETAQPRFTGLVSDMLIDVKQWGSTQWTDMNSMFSGCTNMNMSATDAPNLSFVNDMGHMFVHCDNFNGAIGHWDVSNVTSMLEMFGGCYTFTGEIGDWDVSSVLSMHGMFRGAKRFNTDLERWDVSSVHDMRFMFCFADAFCQDLHGWNVGMVEFEEFRNLANPTKKLVCMETRMTGNPNNKKWYGRV